MSEGVEFVMEGVVDIVGRRGEIRWEGVGCSRDSWGYPEVWDRCHGHN